jgi:uncharacterized integral membrane protein (TIGR02327 family)
MIGMHLGINALVNIIISMISILFCWRILLYVRIDQLLRVKNPAQARALLILLAIVLGHNLGNFFIEYIQWSSMLSHLVQ